tara:strand:- start:583 stop:1614 length:1032 start_codon:yes stop_codon:yes gene_type:complete
MSRARDFADLAGSAAGGGLTGANALINGQFAVAQRGTSFTSGSNDDTDYTLDRWKLFSDGNDVVDVTQETSTVPTNRQTAIALDVETANKKFGIAQIIEQKSCVNLIGETVTLSFQAKVSATTNLDNVKAAIIAWDGTADTVTADMISAWGVEGTNPTLATNFTYENTPANLNLTTSYATYSVTASVDTASAKNIIVFIWSDVTTTSAGEFLYLSDVKLEAGQTATPFEHEDFSTTLAKCQRYYYQYKDDGENRFHCIAGSGGANIIHVFATHPVEMRTSGSVTSSSLNHSINGLTNGDRSVSSVVGTRKNFLIALSYTHTAGRDAGRVQTSSGQSIEVSAEL